MRITPLDLQDSASHWNGSSIEDPVSLTSLLEDSRRRRPFFLELEGANGYKLTIGIGGPLGCVQFASTDGEPPYMVAVSGDGEQSDEPSVVEFLAGGTASPVPRNRCLPFDVVKKLVFRFFEHGDRSPEVQWEDA